MAKEIIVSIVPTTYCENGCDYCYLGPLRNFKDVLSYEKIEYFFKTLKINGYVPTAVQIYGGDLDSDLFQAYRPDFFDEVYYISGLEPNVIGKCGTSITLNIERKDYKENLAHVKKHLYKDVMTVLLPQTYKKGAKALLKIYDSIENWQGYANVYQYQPSAMADAQYEMTNEQYCDFMIELIDSYLNGEYSFQLGIIDELERNRLGKYEEVFGSHIFLFPNGLMADVRYNDRGYEYFELYHTLEEWEEAVERQKLGRRYECTLCENHNTCFAEHWKDWKDGDECCGLKKLVNWWEKNHGRLDSKNQ